MAESSNHNDDDLFQAILELEYGLLDAGEAEALRARIAADPEAARVYANVRRARGLLSQAARFRQPPLVLDRPRPTEIPAAAMRTRPDATRRWMNRLCAAAAALLAVVGVGEWRLHGRSVQRIQADTVLLELAAAPELLAAAPNQFEIRARDLAARPVQSNLDLVLLQESGREILRETLRTDPDGRAEIVLPSAPLPGVATLEVRADAAKDSIPLRATVPVKKTGRIMRLSTDRPFYRPGDEIRIRCVALDRLELRPASDAEVRFVLHDPNGAPTPGTSSRSSLEKGVGFASIAVPRDVPGGVYSLNAKLNDGDPLEQTQELVILDHRPPKLEKKLEFSRSSYSAGDLVAADFRVRRLDGGPAAGARLQIQATLAGERIYVANVEARDDGTCRVAFPLPDPLSADHGVLSIAVELGGVRENVVKPIPLAASGIDLAFLPESGALAAAVVNRVYFRAIGPNQKPIHVEGRILDADGETVSLFQTQHQGMGRFAFVPKPGQSYQVELTSPKGAQFSGRLPVASNNSVVLDSGPGVFEPGRPIEIQVRSNRVGLPLVLALACRGVPVAHRLLETNAASIDVAFHPPDEAAGVLCLTAFDRSNHPPTPIAERLVFRRPGRKLSVELTPSSTVASPGQSVEVALAVRDESGQPAPDAVLGLSVVDRSSFSLVDAKNPSQDAVFFLTSQIARPADLEDADVLLSDDPDAAERLDLVLGVHGWRTFQGNWSDARLPLGALQPAPDPPLLLDNKEAVDRHVPKLLSHLKLRHRAFQAYSLLGLFSVLVLLAMNLMFRRLAWSLAAAAALASVGAVFLAIGNPAAQFAQLQVDDAHPGAAIAREKTGAFAPKEMNLAGRDDFAAESPPNKPDDAGRTAALADRPLAPVPPTARELLPESPAMDKEVAGGGEFDRMEVAERAALAPIQNQVAGRAFAEERARTEPAGGAPQPMRYFEHRRAMRAGPVRSDMTQTLYWNPLLVADENGLAMFGFDLSDALTTFDVRADAHSLVGRLGSNAIEILSRRPFHLEPKLPLAVGVGDQFEIPVAVYNRTSVPLQVDLAVGADGGVRFVGPSNGSASIPSNGTWIWRLSARATDSTGPTRLSFVGVSDKFSDRVEHTLEVAPNDFPHEFHQAAPISLERDILLNLPDAWSPGSLQAGVRIYTDPLAEILDASDALGAEPTGQFELILSVAALNAMALRRMETLGIARPEVTARCRDVLADATVHFADFESPSRGFGRFRGDKASVPLTAYALLLFHDIQRMSNLDRGTLERTRSWLMSQRDGEGEYRTAGDDARLAGSGDPDAVAALATWALVESDAPGISREIERLRAVAVVADRPLLVALAALSTAKTDSGASRFLLERLASMQRSDGSLDASPDDDPSLRVETTALASIAWIRSGQFDSQAKRACDWLRTARRGRGDFGTARATAFALRALMELAEARPTPPSAGEVAISVVDSAEGNTRETPAARVALAASTFESAVRLEGFADRLQPGSNRLRLRASVADAWSWVLDVNYRTDRPPPSDASPVAIQTALDFAERRPGDQLKLTATVVNRRNAPQPTTVAVVGVPSSLEPALEVLDALKTTGLIDAYEARPRELILYWRGLKPGQVVELPIACAAATPGESTGPPSRVYLFDAPETISWTAPLSVVVASESDSNAD